MGREMQSITIALIFILAVILSGTISRLSPVAVPLPLVQIALGAAIAGFTHSGVRLQPEIFFFLFLPPLMFLDGWRIPKEGLLRNKGTILSLAMGLVVFTVLGAGFLIHWMIPAMPLAVAFALAAILSPTDPIAVSAVAARVPIPHRLMQILEGEALLNDASGLVCMRLAVAAALTGTFSLLDAFGTFLWLALGGVALGTGTVLFVMTVKQALVRRYGEESGSEILLSLVLPFGAYQLAEHLGCSGILAAVAAGITMSYVELRGAAMATTRVGRNAVWDTLHFALNGMIFVLFGEQLPRIASGAARIVRETGHLHPVWLVVYVIAITAGLALLRFAWVWVSFRFTWFGAAPAGKHASRPGWRLLVATSLGGTRGAVTLAGILTLPFLMNDGTPFPARDLAIFLAAGVIVLSLIAATIGLPMVLKGIELPPEPNHRHAEDMARASAAEAAIRMISRLQQAVTEEGPDSELYADVASRLTEMYRRRIDGRAGTNDEIDTFRKIEAADRRLRLGALRAQRDEYFRLARKGEIPDDLMRRLVSEIDLMEARYSL